MKIKWRELLHEWNKEPCLVSCFQNNICEQVAENPIAVKEIFQSYEQDDPRLIEWIKSSKAIQEPCHLQYNLSRSKRHQQSQGQAQIVENLLKNEVIS